MNNQTISLCLIAKNEEENIGRCIKSIKEFVEEIVVVDTGSIDNTVEIARSLGAKVIKEEWKNNFSIHRNTSLKNASGDWILFLDCDEELVHSSGQKLKKVIQNDKFEAYFIQIKNKLDATNSVTFSSVRLFKNRDFFRFTGKIHEQIVNSILRYYEPKHIGHTDINVIHHGYDPENTNIKIKIKRNLDILKSYPEEEKNGFYYYNLGTEYLRLGNKKQALKYYMKALEMTTPSQTYGPILVKKTITVLIDLGRYQEAIQQLHYYQMIYKEFKDLFFLEAICHYKCGRYTDAKEKLDKYQNIDIKSSFYPDEENFNGLTTDELKKKLNSMIIDYEYPKLSVCIVGRNEERNIIECIRSVNEVAEELFYMDTGSDDNSCKNAYQMGAKVYQMEWNYNFSKVKNYALSQVSGEWVLFLNADEILSSNGYKKIANIIKNSVYDGYLLPIMTIMDKQSNLGNCKITGKCRLFRNNEYHFNNKYKGEIISSIVKNNGQISSADILIFHLHYLGGLKYINKKARIKIKTIKNQITNELLKKYYLGREYFYNRQFIKANKYFKKIYDKEVEELSFQIDYYYSQSLINVKKYNEAIKILNRANEKFTDYTDLFYLNAIAHFMVGEAEKAESLFKQCLNMGAASWDKYIITPGVESFKSLCSLGTMYVNKQDFEKALKLFLNATKIHGGFKQSIRGIVQVFTLNESSLDLEYFLKKNKLFNSHSLSEISIVYAEMGFYKKSLKYLMTGFQLVQENNGLNYSPHLMQNMEELLASFEDRLNQSLSKNSQLKKLIERQG